MPLFRKFQVSPIDAREAWSVLKGEYDDAPILIRLNTGVRPSVGHPEWGVQIGVAVPFKNPQPDGLPTPEENAELIVIEDRLLQELEQSERAVLVAVITTGQMREFVFYTRSDDWIELWAGPFIDSVHSHTVQTMSRSDPDWGVYRELSGT